MVEFLLLALITGSFFCADACKPRHSPNNSIVLVTMGIGLKVILIVVIFSYLIDPKKDKN
jgi:hypothetical protein